MKKIVGIIAALAMAGAVFAVDVATMIHGWTDLLSMDLATDGAKPSFLGVRDPFDRQYAWYSTGIKFSVAADKCGGSFEVNHRDAEVMSVNAYVQPTDAVKIAVGKIGLATNSETIDYTKLRAFEDREGWAIDLTPVDGLTINTMLVTGAARGWGWAFWGSNGNIGETVAKIGYSADFGSVFALLDFVRTPGSPATPAKAGETEYYIDPKDGQIKTRTVGAEAAKPAIDAANVIDFSAGYSGNFGGVGIFADVAYTMKENANSLGLDLFVDGHADAFGYKVYVKFERGLDSEVNQLCAKFRGSYALDFGNAYLRVVTVDALADKFPIQVQPGLEFNVGAASLDVGFQFDMNSDFDSTNFNNYKAGLKEIHMPLIYRVVF